MDHNAAKKRRPAASPLLAYERVEEDIRGKVRDGRLPAGAMLANRHNLAREYGVSLSTVQQAVANLIADGTLESFDRRGTFVAHSRGAEEETSRLLVSALHEVIDGRAVVDAGHDLSLALPVWKTSATLGILSTARIRPADSDNVGSLWARLVIRSLEDFFSAAGGATRYFDRYPEGRGPYERGFDDANAFSVAEAIHALSAEGADVLAIIGVCDSRDLSDEVVAAVDIERTPTVYISWHEIHPPLAQVYYDNRFAGYQAAQHLLRKGYRRLTFLAPYAEGWLTERIEGSYDAVRHARLPLETLQIRPNQPIEPIYHPERVMETFYGVAQQIFQDARASSGSGAAEPWGIITPNDHTAYLVLKAAAEQGKTAGIDYGLIGFDDDFRSCSLGLSTVRPPIEAMGTEAGQLLLRSLQSKSSGLQVRLRSNVIPRASTALRS